MLSEFPTFPAYRNLCGETREGEMAHILRVAAPERWELCHMLCGSPGRGNCLLDDVCHYFSQGFWVFPPAASAGAMDPETGRLLAEKQKESFDDLLSSKRTCSWQEQRHWAWCLGYRAVQGVSTEGMT